MLGLCGEWVQMICNGRVQCNSKQFNGWRDVFAIAIKLTSSAWAYISFNSRGDNKYKISHEQFLKGTQIIVKLYL